MAKHSLPSYFSLQSASEQIARVHSHLLQWYTIEYRDLPWRSTHDPYAILVSEMMLQQTQVYRVLPKYQQFLAAFPTLAALAAATTADVISNWVPLGYNMRAVRLQAIARQVIAEYGGRIPDSIEELLKLKGVGRYTAGAIACFAYMKQVATVDTNINRVLHRIFLGLEYPEPKLSNNQMLSLAEQVLPDGKAYEWNQALMDLGATICTSSNPQCVRCPLHEVCNAYTEMLNYSLFPSGAVLRQLRKVAEKKETYQSQPFTSTNRYFRGRIVDHLRSLPAGQRIPLTTLGPKIKQEFRDDDLTWLQQLVDRLAKDGLVDYADDGVRLP
jgi:A/G-specific adenine glycosylase